MANRFFLHSFSFLRFFLWVDKHKYKSRNYCKSFKSIGVIFFVPLVRWLVNRIESNRFLVFWLHSFRKFFCKHAMSLSNRLHRGKKINMETNERKEWTQQKKTNNDSPADRMNANKDIAASTASVCTATEDRECKRAKKKLVFKTT